MQHNQHERTTSWYIHWPFCPYRCHFCPFVALASHDQYMAQYHQALKTEITTFLDKCHERPQIDTLFFGGGTPSTYPDELLLDMSDTLSKGFVFGQKPEITIEVNPGTVRPEQFQVWSKVGINRVSIGVQSLNERMLKSLNRHQKNIDVFWLLDEAAAYFDNISVDFILGLPSVSPTQWKELLHKAVTWPIKHISMYFLTVHEQTPLYFKVQTGKVALPVDKNVVDSYYWSVAFLKEHGFEQYEISNFAKPGFACKHNQAYWARVPYKGFGMGACSFDGHKRFGNTRQLMTYLNNAGDHQAITEYVETLSPDQVALEKLMLGLRQTKGMTLTNFFAAIPAAKHEQCQEQLHELERQGYICQKNNSVFLTPAGLAVENEVVVKLSL